MVNSATRIVSAFSGLGITLKAKESRQTTHGSNPKTLESGPLLPHGGGFISLAQIWLTIIISNKSGRMCVNEGILPSWSY